MKKQKIKNIKRDKIIISILSVMLICASTVAIILGCNVKSREEQRYLALYPTLLNISVWSWCSTPATDEVYLSCEVQDYGVNEQGHPYIIFESQTFSADTQELIDGPYLEKMYFWESDTGSFSTAMDKEFKKPVNQ